MTNAAKQLLERYRKHAMALQTLLRLPAEELSRNEVHKLRTSIKKIRAILLLLDRLEVDFDRKAHLSGYVHLFDSAGDVREAQLNLRLLKAYDPGKMGSYKAYLRASEHEAREALDRCLEDFDQTRLRRESSDVREVLEDVRKGEILDGSETIIQKRMHRVGSLLDKLDEDRNLHRIRRHLRVMNEIDGVLESYKTAANGGIHKALKSMHGHIGDWHDHVILLDSLYDFREETDGRRVQHFIDRIEGDTALTKEKLIARLQKSLQHL